MKLNEIICKAIEDAEYWYNEYIVGQFNPQYDQCSREISGLYEYVGELLEEAGYPIRWTGFIVRRAETGAYL